MDLIRPLRPTIDKLWRRRDALKKTASEGALAAQWDAHDRQLVADLKAEIATLSGKVPAASRAPAQTGAAASARPVQQPQPAPAVQHAPVARPSAAVTALATAPTITIPSDQAFAAAYAEWRGHSAPQQAPTTSIASLGEQINELGARIRNLEHARQAVSPARVRQLMNMTPLGRAALPIIERHAAIEQAAARRSGMPAERRRELLSKTDIGRRVLADEWRKAHDANR